MKFNTSSKKYGFSGIFFTCLLIISVVHIGLTYLLKSKLEQSISSYEKIVAHNIEMDKIWLKRFEPVYISIPGATKIRALREDYTKANSLWFYVNKTYSTPQEYVPQNLIVPNLASSGNLSIRSDIVTNLTQMFEEAKKEGISLKIGSAYRSYDYQTNLFNSNAAKYGAEITNQTIALPGHSEHQLGLALDIVSNNGGCYIETCFENLNEGIWLANNASRFGFILRYPKTKESITGYSYEPWHFRYVGIDLAKALSESGLTFDEAYGYLKDALTILKNNNAKLNN